MKKPLRNRCMNCRGLVLFAFLVTSLPSFVSAQELNDELKKRMRESLMTPDMPPLQPLQSHQPVPWDIDRKPDEILKVSPITRLPTKYDRIRLPPRPEELKIKMHIIPTNSPPINMRPIGSVEYVHDAGKMYIRSTAGKLVVPSGGDLDPVRAYKHRRTEKQRKRLLRMLDAY